MLKLFLFHLITFTGLQLLGQERVQVSPEASIEFPCSPKIETQNIITTATCRSSNTIYQVLLLDFSTVDGFVIGADDIDEFYRGYIDGQSEKIRFRYLE